MKMCSFGQKIGLFQSSKKINPRCEGLKLIWLNNILIKLSPYGRYLKLIHKDPLACLFFTIINLNFLSICVFVLINSNFKTAIYLNFGP